MPPAVEHLDPQEPREPEDCTFRNLMRQVRTGSEREVLELFERCEPHILRVVRRRLNVRLRSRFDSQDFAQAVWASFFADVPSLSRFDEEEELVAYLGRMAINKIIEQCRAHLDSGKRRIEREVGLDESPPVHEATPSQFAMANERWHQLTDDLTLAQRELLALRMAGYTYEEIAAKSGQSERTVRRLLARLERRAAG